MKLKMNSQILEDTTEILSKSLNMISTIPEKYIEALACAETGETVCTEERKKSRRKNTVLLNPSELSTRENPEHNKNIGPKSSSIVVCLSTQH